MRLPSYSPATPWTYPSQWIKSMKHFSTSRSWTKALGDFLGFCSAVSTSSSNCRSLLKPVLLHGTVALHKLISHFHSPANAHSLKKLFGPPLLPILKTQIHVFSEHSQQLVSLSYCLCHPPYTLTCIVLHLNLVIIHRYTWKAAKSHAIAQTLNQQPNIELLPEGK